MFRIVLLTLIHCCTYYFSGHESISAWPSLHSLLLPANKYCQNLRMWSPTFRLLSQADCVTCLLPAQAGTQMGVHIICLHYYCLPRRQKFCARKMFWCFDVPLPFHTHQLSHLLYCFALNASMRTCMLMHPSLLRIFVGCRQRNKRMCVVRLFTWYKDLGWAEEAVSPACNFSPHVESDHQSAYTHPSSTQQQWGNFQWLWGKQWHEHNQQQLHLNIS